MFHVSGRLCAGVKDNSTTKGARCDLCLLASKVTGKVTPDLWALLSLRILAKPRPVLCYAGCCAVATSRSD
jgi:hypothetical protein